jgi:CENP-B N-terminal DNA-binding domain
MVRLALNYDEAPLTADNGARLLTATRRRLALADGQVACPKRQGNYTPSRIKQIEQDVADRYDAGESARSLAREYDISKTTVRKIVDRLGRAARDKAAAGALLRTRKPTAPIDPDQTVSIAYQVAVSLGYASSKGLSKNRAFRTACMREYAARNPDVYRRNEARRKKAENRIPAWVDRKGLDTFWDLANERGHEVDHIIPLLGDIISGLNVPSNLRTLPASENMAKQNKFVCGADPLIALTYWLNRGPPEGP